MASGRLAVSSAVYSGLTVMPSGVTQFKAFTSPPGADLAAALAHASSEAAANSGALFGGVSLMAEASPKMAVGA
ncbi:hypothetical protein D3C72_1756050 [compost metagenome]